ncbi:MAG: ArsB/NhaD family transporter [Eubacteriales bacterium]|jgi:Na+/H+ antiporter NhaD/arsenite permease-like protein
MYFFALAIFLLTYAVIVSEKVHRTIAALIGAGLLMLSGVLTVEDAIEYIDWNTIGLLIGMMIIVGITRNTGVFEYLAVRAAKMVKGNPVKIMMALALVTAVASAFLDNVTTVLLIVPVTFAIARQLKVNPIPILVAEIISSNIGGTATLIGDPPNIMIGSSTGLGFMDFVFNLAPVIVVVHVITVTLLILIYRKHLVTTPELQKGIMKMDEKEELKDISLLKQCLVVLSLTILGFVIHQYIHLESSVIALSGASLLLLLSSRHDPEQALHAVEWPVIFFFAGLFLVVGGIEKVGIIEAIARFTIDVTHGLMVPAGMLILWVSAIASAFVDNIPFVATMIPLIKDMGQLGMSGDLNFLWWSLSLGACLGGNGTIIGASANVVVVGMAEKRGFPITFISYMKVAFPAMLVSIVLSMCYMLFWYHYHGLVSILGTLAVGVVLALITIPINNSLSKSAISAISEKSSVKRNS